MGLPDAHTTVMDRKDSTESERPIGDISSECNILAARLAWGFVFVGITTRLLRYLLRFPLWGDECMLAENLLTRDALRLLRPLDHAQVAPIGFIEIVWGLTRLFGFNEFTLRLVSVVASLTSLVAMRQLAFRLLPPIAAMFAVAFLATSYYQVRHAAEFKPYAIDLAWSIFLLLSATNWCHAPHQRRWLYILWVLTPLALITSFTAVFVAGGICIGLLAHARFQRSFRDLWRAVKYSLFLVVTFCAIYLMTAVRQYETHGSSMQEYWKNSFPPSPVSETIGWFVWMIGTHTGEMFAYPLGANHGGSILTFLMSILGAHQIWRRCDRWFVILCMATFGLSYFAATLHRYPYGGNERLVQHLGPMICLLAGSGMSFLIGRIQTIGARRTTIQGIAIVFCLVSTGSSIRDVIRPYKFQFDMVHCSFAKWFWQPDRDTTDLYCVDSDLGIHLWPGAWHSHYLCYQHIYSPKHPIGKPVTRISDLPPGCPANVVVYSSDDDPEGVASWDLWMTEMSQRFDLLDSMDHRVLIDRKKQATVWGHYRIYRFVPKSNETR